MSITKATTVVQILLGLLVFWLLTASSCNRDNDGPSVNPSINFIMDSGYTYQSDTLTVSDTLRIGIVIQKGDENLRTFKVQSVYDGLQPVTLDSLPVGTETYEFEKQIILRDVPGTEKWSFLVEENDGDIIRRSLTFVVVE